MHAQHTRTRRSRSGFTLIELMVVILIIAILAGLLLVAVWGAMGTATDARTLIEIDQMAQALEAYKSHYGEYPPIGTQGANPARIQAHLAKAFPKYVAEAAVVTALDRLTPDQALVFWLGGMPVTAGGGLSVEGFSANVASPFRSTSIGSWSGRTTSGSSEAVQRTRPFFEFDQRRIRTPSASPNNFFWVYVPHGKTSPYVYFPAGPDGYYTVNTMTGAPTGVKQFNHPTGGLAVPYKATAATVAQYALPTSWVNPKTYQIIAAGADDAFGGNTDRVYPIGTGYTQQDEDNLTNFAGRRLSRDRP